MIEKEEYTIEAERSAYPTVKQGWGIIGILLIIVIGYSLPVGLIQLALGDTLKGPMSFINYAVPFIILIFVTRIWWKKNPKNENTLLFKSFPLAILPAVVIITLAMLIVNVEITSWVPAPEWLMELFKDMAQDNLWGLITIAVAAPILEEILMRGIVLDGMLKNYNPWKAIIWSAVLFGIMHFNPWQFVSAFFIGIVMGYLYWKTKSLALTIFIHALNNGTAFYLMKMNPEAVTWTEMFGLSGTDRVIVFTGAIFIIFFAYKYFERFFKSREILV
ncbi:CPBP family intramembrane metalloprotease [Marinifilum sp. N1E240]|uniref:CPBP family intramembrane glutamic endopeptidase n=1 Tax=Marinifilum sp. N1E240 TaxID=2608082 RepID=UPI00128B51CB|nr:type II CAAX endopeptidase family protein [Marinifilum sp. N1E240]MPQ45701.1 CPBP family intramembrane metalloprotease [Marinifilum sp. N1E240]